MRTEVCVCGGTIRASEVRYARPFVEAHNRSLLHMRWRWSQGIVTPEFAGPHDPRRHWPTADDATCDMDQGDVGASADGVEGTNFGGLSGRPRVQ